MCWRGAAGPCVPIGQAPSQVPSTPRGPQAQTRPSKGVRKRIRRLCTQARARTHTHACTHKAGSTHHLLMRSTHCTRRHTPKHTPPNTQPNTHPHPKRCRRACAAHLKALAHAQQGRGGRQRVPDGRQEHARALDRHGVHHELCSHNGIHCVSRCTHVWGQWKALHVCKEQDN